MMKMIGIQNEKKCAVVEAGADRNEMQILIQRLESIGLKVDWYGFDTDDDLQEQAKDLMNYYSAVLIVPTMGPKIG